MLRHMLDEILDKKYLTALMVAEMVNQPIHIVAPDETILYVNRAWSVVYGVTQDEAIGKKIHEAVKLNNAYISFEDSNPDFSSIQFDHLEMPINKSAAVIAMEKGETISLVSQTPSYNKVMVTSTPIYDENGKIVCAFTLIQDLTMLASWRDIMEEELQKNRLVKEELERLRNEQVESTIVGNSKASTDLKKMIYTVGNSDANVLICGESGVGKEVAAKEICRQGKRADKPFVAVNCAAIPENLLESELFGHEKGAFTGAIQTKLGMFELAGDGTIMLDEIGEFPLRLQPKLLRVLQEREFQRVGGTKKIKFGARVIAATNRDLLSMTKTGEFRMDLYYRLNVFQINLKPLRERKDDIALLANTFLKTFNEKYAKEKFFTAQAVFALEQYPWPGNVRELENAIERAIVIGDQPAITADHIAAVLGQETIFSDSEEEESAPNTAVTLKEAVDNLERELIQNALRTYKTTYKAAEALGSTQPTIARKAKALGITKW